MRYAQGGGLTDAERAVRERLRLQAVERFQTGQKNTEIAKALRVSERSVERWRRAWREGGEAGLHSRGSPGRPRLSDAQIARLERELERGPLAHGWADQRWTLAWIKTLIGRLFHVSYTVEGTWRSRRSACTAATGAGSPMRPSAPGRCSSSCRYVGCSATAAAARG
ncbi:helix-turn-helix domain-containing protein [Streptomyces mirabilis]|uniref:helix-turn-helix domain-containing protein n=1 Tax=Streptomyces mirabilis TaxID=68239 RepID=UPI0036AFE82B